MTDAERLQRLEDREAIRELIATYCHRIASGDVETVLPLFTADCVVDILGTRYEGEAGLRALYADSLAVEPKPFVHNQSIEIEGPGAARGQAVFEIRQTREGAEERSVGCYADVYAKDAGRWRFRRRTFSFY